MSFPPNIRSAPSGPRVLPASPSGIASYTASAPATVTLLPTGHRAGYYLANVSVFVLTAASAGNFTSLFGWNDPLFGPATLPFGATNLTGTGLVFTVTRAFESDGSAPIVWTVTPAGVTGSPIARVSSAAILLAGPVP